MNDLTQTPEMIIGGMGARARNAATILAGATSEAKAKALIAAAKALRAATTKIILANRQDMDRGAANGLAKFVARQHPGTGDRQPSLERQLVATHPSRCDNPSVQLRSR